MSTPESGTAAPTSRLESASESAGSAALDGDGAIGDGTGTTTTRSLTITGTTRRVGRFTTATITTEEEACAAEFVQEQRDLPPQQGRAPAFSTGPVQQPGPSRATRRLPEDTLNPEVKAEPARAPSATKATGESQGATLRAEAPASVEERVEAAVEGTPAVEAMAVAGAINRSFLYALGDPEIQK